LNESKIGGIPWSPAGRAAAGCLSRAIGQGSSDAGSRLLSGLLFGVEATDPLKFLAVLLLLGGAAGLAGWIPARAASRTDPMQILQED